MSAPEALTATDMSAGNLSQLAGMYKSSNANRPAHISQNSTAMIFGLAFGVHFLSAQITPTIPKAAPQKAAIQSRMNGPTIVRIKKIHPKNKLERTAETVHATGARTAANTVCLHGRCAT